MSRSIYTYTDLTKINRSPNFLELSRYPQIVVSTDLRKCLNGRPEIDRVQGLAAGYPGFRVTEFSSFAGAIDSTFWSDQGKFEKRILLSAFMREKLKEAGGDGRLKNWLTGCQRNLDSMLSALLLLEQADAKPEELAGSKNRNLELFAEAWRYLEERDPSIRAFRARMDALRTKSAWAQVFRDSLQTSPSDGIDKVVFHGFYYITPYQERIMRLLEGAGFELIFLIPYDERYPFAYEIWDETYSVKRGYPPKSRWHIEKAESADPYGEIFEGKEAQPHNRLTIREYASVMEFVDDVEHIRERGFSLYSANHRMANELLQDYFPEACGDRKLLSYPIGQFLNRLNRMWDEEKQEIVLEEETLIECFSSGWLAADGISGRQVMQDLMYVLPFFRGCHTLHEWEERIALFREIQSSAVASFEAEGASRWQKALGNPLKSFSMFAIEPERLDILLKLIDQLLKMARELFGKNEAIRVQEHIRKLDQILKKYGHSDELYEEEQALVSEIFDRLDADNGFDAVCRPSDIASAVEFFINGNYDEGELQSNRVGLVYPLYFVEAACVKNKSRVHLCMSDAESLPGRGKDYIWPLTGKIVKELYASTGNALLLNLVQVMEAEPLCNRYFTYCALKNREVTVSWISAMGEKLLAPSPYIKLLTGAAGVDILPSARHAITWARVADTPAGEGRIRAYDPGKTPAELPKEAQMDYALCPMRYVLGYVLERFPVYQSDFQMTYALNALISAMYGLMKEQGIRVEEAYRAAVALFPNLRRAERRQVYDYLAYDRRENDLDYDDRTKCGGRSYTDERLKIHYPNQNVRAAAITKFEQLQYSDGSRELNLCETMETEDACIFCPHCSYCRNALFAGDQESYYD